MILAFAHFCPGRWPGRRPGRWPGRWPGRQSGRQSGCLPGALPFCENSGRKDMSGAFCGFCQALWLQLCRRRSPPGWTSSCWITMAGGSTFSSYCVLTFPEPALPSWLCAPSTLKAPLFPPGLAVPQQESVPFSSLVY